MVATKEDDLRHLLKTLSYLFQYPEKNWLQVNDLMTEVEELPDCVCKEKIRTFLTGISLFSLEGLAAHYVEIFDFTPACSLNLSFSKVGETPERSGILVELKTMYREHGFDLTDEELPDYLPVVLEFASIAPITISTNLLNSFRDSVEKLIVAVKEVSATSPYLDLLDLCLRVTDKMENFVGGDGS